MPAIPLITAQTVAAAATTTGTYSGATSIDVRVVTK